MYGLFCNLILNIFQNHVTTKLKKRLGAKGTSNKLAPIKMLELDDEIHFTLYILYLHETIFKIEYCCIINQSKLQVFGQQTISF